METLFKAPAMPGASQFVPARRHSIPNTPNFTINYLIYSHDVNQGKGAAIHPDSAEATGAYSLVQDADQKYVVNGSSSVGSYPHRIPFFWQSTRR